MQRTSFVKISLSKKRAILEPIKEMISPTEQCKWRNKMLWGEVHDDNAWILGGVAPHCGLFSSVNDIFIIMSELVLAIKGKSKYFKNETAKKFLITGFQLRGYKL